MMLGSINFFNKGPKYLNLEQRLLQKLLYFNVTKYIKELMFLGFEYSFSSPLVLTLESTKGYFFTSPLLRFNELLKLNYNIKEFDTITYKKNTSNSYSIFLKLLNSFNRTNAFSNALHIMSNTGAKANWNQICQLIGLRGYLSNATGDFFKIPVLNSFNKGLNLFEYFISCYGARKGILDTALKTADAGYLTRRLVESAQEIVIKEYTCGTNNSFEYNTYINTKGSSILPFFLLLSGKTLKNNLVDIKTKKLIDFKHNYISESLINYLYSKKYNHLVKLNTSSIKLCSVGRTICSTCFGYSTFKTTLLGKSVGILSGQVIGEPGTQLTLRTFHTGGVSSMKFSNSKINNSKYISKYFYLFNKTKYKICGYLRKNFVNKSTNIFSTIYIKQNYFTLDSSYLVFILKKYKLNQLIFIKNKLFYLKNKVSLSNLLLTYLSLNNIYQRKNKSKISNLNNYSGEILFKNVIQLIVKNKYNKWICINLKKTLLLKNYYKKHHLSMKDKLIIVKSRNQRFSKLIILTQISNLFSYKKFENKNSCLYIWRTIFSNNKYSYTRYNIVQNIKYFKLNNSQMFKTTIQPLKLKKFCINI